MVAPYLNKLGGEVDNDVSLFNGGINSYSDKAFLESDSLPYSINMSLRNPPAIGTRKGRTTIANYLDNNIYSEDIGEIIDIYTYNEYQFFVIAENGGKRYIYEFYRRTYSSGVYAPKYTIKKLDNNGSVVEVPKEDKYYFTLARQATNDWVYVTGLNFKIKISIGQNPLYTRAELINDTHYGICCTHKGRLFLAQPDSNIVTFSALYDYDNFDEITRYALINNPIAGNSGDDSVTYITSADDFRYQKWKYENDSWVADGYIYKTEITIDQDTMISVPDYSVIAGDFKVTNSIGQIVSLKSFDDKLMIFCEHSMHTLYGDTPDVSLSNQFQLVDLNNNLGAVSDRCVAIGGGRLFWLGDDKEVYEYTGSSINLVSKPGTTRNATISHGGISGLPIAYDVIEDRGNNHAKFVATSSHLYINIWNERNTSINSKRLFVFDLFNRVWWCEDGDFNTIGNFSDHKDKILLGKSNGDLLVNNRDINNVYNGKDYVYNFSTNAIEEEDIEYEFHTRVYGADGVDLRKTIDKVWVQARANADMYLNDVWSLFDDWNDQETTNLYYKQNFVKIGTLKYEVQQATQPTLYRPDTYEQQVCYVEKMYGQRLNAFQIIVKGKGDSKFWLMKRMWRAR